MDYPLQHDAQHLDHLLEQTKRQALAYLHQLPSRATSIIEQSELPDALLSSPACLQEAGVGAEEALYLFNQSFEQIIVASSGARYWGFVTGGTTPAAIMGDWLSTVYDQNTQTVRGQGDVSARIEIQTIDLLVDLLQLPARRFVGGFVSGATMSNFTCLAVARQWVGHERGVHIASEGMYAPIPVLAATPHSSVLKALSMLGMGSGQLTRVETLPHTRECICVQDLQRHIAQLHPKPFILVSSAGTVNTADFDDFKAISALRQKYRFWWHIDAAFGAFAACSPLYKHFVEGWEEADSITLDGHKWLNVPYESGVFLIHQRHQPLQVATFQNTQAPYLGTHSEQFTYLDMLPENSRRLKALPAWFSLKAYGKKGYRDLVEKSVLMAQRFARHIESSEAFELVAPVHLNNVCFTPTRAAEVATFLTKLNSTGKVFMTRTSLKGVPAVRASFVNWRTSEADVDLVIDEMKRIATIL